MPWSRACLFLLGSACALLLATPAHAVTVDRLHTASVTVADQGADTRERAFREALERVLVKMAGRPGVLDQEGVDGLLDAAGEMVQQYGYERIERSASEVAEGDTGDMGDTGDEQDEAAAEPELRLNVTFAGRRIRERLEGLDIVVWGRERPEVLVWLAIDDAGGRRILDADGGSPANVALAQSAERRALPILLPLMDTEDRTRVEFVDISGGFYDTVREASQRYRASTLLVGHARRSGGAWQADWSLIGLGQRRAWTARADSMQAVLAAGVDGATNRLAAKLAGQSSDRRAILVEVQDVAGVGDYARLERYFSELARVESAALLRARPQTLMFDLRIKGRLEDFERSVALGDLLVQVERRLPQASSSAEAAAGTGAAVTQGLDDPDAKDPSAGASAGGSADPLANRPVIVFRLAK